MQVIQRSSSKMQDLVAWATLSQAGSNLGHVNIIAGTNVVCVAGVGKEEMVEGEEIALPWSPS